MRDLRRVERDAVILKNIETSFLPHFKQTIFITQRIKGKIVCQSDSLHYLRSEAGRSLAKRLQRSVFDKGKERRFKFMRKGGED